MRKVFLFVSLIILIASCTQDDPDKDSCNPENQAFTVSKNWGYSGSVFLISGEEICEENIQSVQFNDQTVEIQGFTVLYIRVIPDQAVDSATVTIHLTDRVIELEEKVTIYPSGGRWEEIASFPSEGRSRALAVSSEEKAYLMGGSKYLGYFEDKYQYQEYRELYEYEPETDQWGLIATNNFFEVYSKGFYSDGEIIYGNYNFFSYDVNSNLLGLADDLPIFFGEGFSLEGEGYVAMMPDYDTLEIHRYDLLQDEWQQVYSQTFEYLERFHFVFEYGGQAYIGLNGDGYNGVEIWRFNPDGNTFTLLNSEFRLDPGVGLKLLYVINDIAYFTLLGSGHIDQTEIVYTPPEHFLYGYNIHQNEWIELEDNLPVPFRESTSFTVNNRGFVGLNTAANGEEIDYDTRFWEFIPE